MRKQFALPVLLALFVQTAMAQLTPISPELQAFVMRPDQKKAVMGSIFSGWHILEPACSTPQLKQMNVRVINPPAFDASGSPTSGQWRMVGHVEGCGEEKIMNVEYWFGSDGKMMMTQILPGTSIADLLLEKDAIFYARMAMTKLVPRDCNEMQILDTKFLQFDGGHQQTLPGREDRPWTEEWTVRACGVKGAVPMHFIPDATGTTIRSDLAKALQ
jgi:hypothetical protein